MNISENTAKELIDSFYNLRNTFINTSNIFDDMHSILMDNILLELQIVCTKYKIKSIESVLLGWYYNIKFNRLFKKLEKLKEIYKTNNLPKI